MFATIAEFAHYLDERDVAHTSVQNLNLPIQARHFPSQLAFLFSFLGKIGGEFSRLMSLASRFAVPVENQPYSG